MSVQLSILPQNDQGFDFTANPIRPNLVNDSSFFLASLIGTTNNQVSGQQHQASLNAVLASNPTGIWKTYNRTGHTVPSFHSYGSGFQKQLRLHGNASSGSTGCYQLVSGFTVGLDYDVEITTGTNSGSNELYLGVMSASSGWTNGALNFTPIPVGIHAELNPTTFTATFEAHATDLVILLDYQSSNTNDLDIKKVTIKMNAQDAPVNLTDVTRGEVIVDLYKETNIPLNLSVDEFTNVAEKVQSYSQSFTLPATKRNNRIFTHIFETTISSQDNDLSFNPQKRTKAILKEDGYTIFDGYLKLIKVNYKKGEISYTVNLFSKTVTLKDTLGDRTFNDFDGGALGGGVGLSELEHTFTTANIKSSFEGNLPIATLPILYNGFAGNVGDTTTDVLKYPFCRWSGNILKSDGTDTPAGSPELTSVTDAFRPWIKCKYLFDRIIKEAGFSYRSDFLNSSTFTRLYMDFNWGGEGLADNTATTTNAKDNPNSSGQVFNSNTFTKVQFPTNNAGIVAAGWNDTDHNFVAAQDNQEVVVDCTLIIPQLSNPGKVVSRIIRRDSSGNDLEEYTHTDPNVFSTYFGWLGVKTFTCDAGDKISVELRIESGSLKTSQSSRLGFTSLVQPTITSATLLRKRGEIQQWSFVKSIFDMFNLVVLPDPTNETVFTIEPYEDVFITGNSQYIDIQTHDWTEKIDIDDMSLSPLKLDREIVLSYTEDSDDYPTKNYKLSAGRNFGEKILDASQFFLSQGKKEITPLFAATYMVPIFESFTGLLTVPNIVAEEDNVIKEHENVPRILYDVSGTTNASIAGDVYRIPQYFGSSPSNESEFCRFSHIDEFQSTANSQDYNFGAHQIITSLGQTPVNNLYSVFWSPYFDELYNSDTKTFTCKIYLTSVDITKFNFNDKIRIKNRLFRVNKIKYKPYELSTCEFILLP